MKVITFLTLLFLSACSLFKNQKIAQDKSASIQFKHDTEITRDGKSDKFKAGDKVELTGDDVIRAEAKGRVSMLIYPVNDKKGDLDISLPVLDSSKITEIQNQIMNKKLDLILPEIQKVQVMMIKKDYVNALSKVRDLKILYPGIAFLSFIEGACYKVLGRRSEALQVITEGLDIYPESSEAKELYKQVSGKDL